MTMKPSTCLAISLALIAASGVIGCGSKTATVGPPGDGAAGMDAGADAELADTATPDGVASSTQVPPATSGGLDAWMASSPWMGWTCEPAPREARPSSPHQTVRVCENDVLTTARAVGGTGDFPVGAAAVKEMYYQGAIWAVAIAVRGKPGIGGDSWFWWRKVLDGTETPAITHADYGDAFCAGCHAGAASGGGRDFIFTSVP